MALILLMTLVGCGGTIPVIKGEGALESVSSIGAGFVAGSIGKVHAGEERSPFQSQYIWIQSQESGEAFRIAFVQNDVWKTPVDFETETIQGSVFWMPLPPGDYEIFRVNYEFTGGPVIQRFYNEEPFSIPFTISEGRTSYLGQFMGNVTWGRSLLGTKTAAGGYFELENMQERDFELLSAKYSDFNAESADVALPIIPPELEAFFR
ncbi:hypothetical protein [Wenzhouxiangella marina]|uniref:hypothetical protein n=1 Tax=Wenzhouxiangella marina TaxID=1579979 RepID=UPI0012E22761|nr:hypothetical protein [Wenzhouxiangella marina]MBB6087965.1 hypothetical protein [Wenzhouxiangella marina]